MNDTQEKTHVTRHNWPELQQQGVVFVTNSFYSTHDFDPLGYSEHHEMLAILCWDTGAENIFEGDPMENEEPTPGAHSDAYSHAVGLYARALGPDWAPFFSRWIFEYDECVVEAGLSRHLRVCIGSMGRQYEQRWQVWRVYGSDERFRCWGPDSTTEGFEGTLPEVFAHIKQWDAEHGDEYIWPWEATLDE